VLTGIARFWSGLIEALALIAALVLGAMALHVSYDVVARYFFDAPTSWSNDLSEYSLLWGTFLAVPWLVRNRGHVRIDLITELLSNRIKAVLEVIVSIAAAAVCVIAAWQTAVETWDYFRRGIMIAKVWELPQWIPYAAMPVGFGLAAIEFLRVAYRAGKGR
jgi:TRAP-type C4-dicarboxylate transport system permease small subunit